MAPPGFLAGGGCIPSTRESVPRCLAILAGSGGDPTSRDSAPRRRLAILVGGSGGPST